MIVIAESVVPNFPFRISRAVDFILGSSLGIAPEVSAPLMKKSAVYNCEKDGYAVHTVHRPCCIESSALGSALSFRSS